MSESSYILDSKSVVNQNKNDSPKKSSPAFKQSNINKAPDSPKNTNNQRIVENSENQIQDIQKEINLIKTKLGTTYNQISLFKENLYCIPASYTQNMFEIEKSKIEDHLKIELQNKDNLEKLLEIKTHELQLKNEEINLKSLEKGKEKAKEKLYPGSIFTENVMDIERAKIDLEMASKSLISREYFYEKEIKDLTKAENSLRESLITLGKTSEINSSSLAMQIENLRKEIQIQRLLYNNKLDEYRLKSSLSKEDIFEIDYLAEKIRKNEEEVKTLEEKQIGETIMSPNRKIALLKVESQLADILRLRNEVENERKSLILEKEIHEARKNKILSIINAQDNAKIQEELEQYRSKYTNLQKTIEYYKMKLSESVYAHDNSQSFEDYKKLLTIQNYELAKLKNEMNLLGSKLLNIEYPQLSSRVELSNLENELRHREIEINSYLREKEQIRNSVESFRNSFQGELSSKRSVASPISSISPISPNKYSYQYLTSSNFPSGTNENAYGSYLNLSTLETNFKGKSEELKALLAKNDIKGLKEESRKRQAEIKNLRDMLYERDITLNRIIKKGEYTSNPLYKKVYEERKRIFEIYLNIKNDLLLIGAQINSPSKISSPSQFKTSQLKVIYSPRPRALGEMVQSFPIDNTNRYTESQNDSLIKIKDLNLKRSKSPSKSVNSPQNN